MAARVYYANATVGRSTTGSATYGDHVSQGFTPNASKGHAVFFGGLLDHSATTSDCRLRLYHDTAATALMEFNLEPQDTTDNFQIAGAAVYTSPGSPSAQTFSVEYSAEAGTAGLQDSWIAILELHANDKTSVTAAEQSTSSASHVPVGPSVTVGAGNWLIIGAAQIASTSAGATAEWEIHNGTTQIVATGPAYLQDINNYVPLFQMVRVSPGGSTTYSMNFKSDGTNLVFAKNSVLIALDLSQFDDVIYGDSLGESSTTSSSAQTKLSVTDTPAAADYLQLFACSRKHDSTANSGYTDYTRGGAAISVEAEREANHTTEYMDHGYGAVSALTAVSTDWLTRYRTEVSTATYIKNAAFAALQVGAAASASFQGGMIRSGGVLPTEM